jgi:predicted metal-dependent phosphoesterase TrpH
VGLADPHCHTVASDGMVDAATLVDAAVALGLDLIAVTDHDTMAAVREAQARGAEQGLEVVPGLEVTTRWPAQTHVVAWFVARPVRAGMSLADTVAAIHDQGGLAVIPHPFMPTYFASCQPGMLSRLIEDQAIDGIEVVHTAPTTDRRAAALDLFYSEHRSRLGAAIGASDSHFGRHDLAKAVTEYEGRSASDFRQAVVAGTTQPSRRGRRRVPAALLARQQVRALLELPARRLMGRP